MRSLAVAIFLAAPTALAHVGSVPAKANFLHPKPPGQAAADGGIRYSYVPEEADKSFTIDWFDGDLDPTGKFTFYWFDHAISDGVTAPQVEQNGKVLRERSGRDARDLWVSCTCDSDAGVECPDAGVRRCPNAIDWDTSALPDGAYWIAAVNNDPPFHVYNLTYAPVLVHHGATNPPVVIVLRPDGIGTADKSYRVQVIAAGTGAMTLQLAYGDNVETSVLGPTRTIAKGLAVTVGGDGTFTYDWDTSMLPNALGGGYFVRATLADGSGRSSYADSRYGVSVLHRDGDGGDAPADLAMMTTDAGVKKLDPSPKGCSCAVGARPSRAPWLLLALLALVGHRTRKRPTR